MEEYTNLGDKKLLWILSTLEKNADFFDKKADTYENRIHALSKERDSFRERAEQCRRKYQEAEEAVENLKQRAIDQAKRETRDQVKNLTRLVNLLEGKDEKIAADKVAVSRAKTFAIMDSILFAIENWASDESPAPDITLASQATLFPVMLQKVSSGDDNYYLTEVPSTAYEVVKRGREFVQQFREQEHISVLDPTGWQVLQPILHQWWTRDGLPMLYGQGYEGWEFEEPLTLDQMLTWKNMEMSRAMDFPLIFDGFELVKKYGDEIREESGLPDFNRTIMQSRIRVND